MQMDTQVQMPQDAHLHHGVGNAFRYNSIIQNEIDFVLSNFLLHWWQSKLNFLNLIINLQFFHLSQGILEGGEQNNMAVLTKLICYKK